MTKKKSELQNKEDARAFTRKSRFGRRFFHRFFYSTVIVCTILFVGLYILYERIQPKVHFTKSDIPVVAKPTATSTQILSPTVVARQSLVHDGIFNVLLLGIDARSKGQAARTDSIVLVHVDIPRHNYEIISIPRDTRVQLPQYGYTKITHANYMGELNGGLSEGTKETIQAVSNLTGMVINYYAETNYWGLQDIVDSLGGITVQVPFSVTLTHAWYPEDNGKKILAGTESLQGKMVTELVHERYSLQNGDFGRQQLQEDVLIGIAKQLFKPSSLQNVGGFLRAVPKYLVTTNLSSADLVSMFLAVKEFNDNQVQYFQVPGHSAYMHDPIVRADLYYWIPDMNALHQILKNHFMNG